MDLPWGKEINYRKFRLLGHEIIWQPALSLLKGADLIIIPQQNRLLINYWLQLKYILGGTRVALWGHGRNFQSNAPRGIRERFKRFWLRKAHWWFAYTKGSVRVVEQAGFPSSRISVINNSIDTRAMIAEMQDIGVNETEEKRRELGINSNNVCIYVGGLYEEKRLGFLIEAAIQIRERVPDFELLVVGGGIDAPLVERAARDHEFIHYLGPRFGREKTVVASMCKALLMPGAVGLVILDSFAYGLPMITTNTPSHGPEIDYLVEGVNGIVVPDSGGVDAYAKVVAGLLQDEDRWRALCAGALKSSEDYSIENMAQRFAAGVMSALNTA